MRLPGALRSATARSLGLSFGVSLAIQVLNVVTGVLLARALGPEGRGELVAVVLWPSVVAALGSLGVSEAVTFHAARGTLGLGALVGTTVALTAAQSALLVGIGAVAIPLALSSHDPTVVDTAYLYLAFVPLNLLTLGLLGVLNGLHRFRAFHTLRLLVIGASTVALISLWAAGELTVRNAAFAYLAANAATLVATAAAVARGRVGSLSVSRPLLGELLRFGAKSHTSNVSALLNERLDQLVISIFLAPARLGLYVVAVTVTSLTTLIGSSVSLVALPTIARARDDEERRRLACRLTRLTVVASVAITVPLLVLAPTLIELVFGAGFRSAGDAARVLLAAAILLSVSRVLGAVLKAANRPLDAGVAEALSLVATTAALAVLLPWLGILGAAIASLIAYGVGIAWYARRAARALDTSVLSLLLPVPLRAATLRS